jgi:hypothetical protein
MILIVSNIIRLLNSPLPHRDQIIQRVKVSMILIVSNIIRLLNSPLPHRDHNSEGRCLDRGFWHWNFVCPQTAPHTMRDAAINALADSSAGKTAMCAWGSSARGSAASSNCG